MIKYDVWIKKHKCEEEVMKKESSARMSLILAMIIFGTIGIFRKYIPLSSGIVAWVRGVLGVAFLLIFIKMKKINMDWNSPCAFEDIIDFRWIDRDELGAFI